MKSRRKTIDVVMIDNGYGLEKPTEYRRILAAVAPERSYYYKKRKPASYIEAIRTGYDKSKKSDTVLIIRSDTKLVDTTLRQLTDRTSAGKWKPFVLVTLHTEKTGLRGIVVSLNYCVQGLLRGGRQLLRFGQRFESVPCAVLTVNDLRTLTGKKRFAFEDSVLVNGPVNTDWTRASKLKRFMNFLLRAVAASAYVAAAIYVLKLSGAETFLTWWLTIAICAVAVISFDRHIASRRKFDMILCSGFLPILLCMAIFPFAGNTSPKRNTNS